MRISWGILSTAHINRRIIPAIQLSGRGRLTGVASRDLVKAHAYASQWNIPNAYGSYEALLEDPQIQAVYISLPNHLHTKWILHSLEAGKHVLCEKPICLSLEEMDQIRDASDRTGCKVMEGYMHLYHLQTDLWKTIFDSGALGEIHRLQSCFSFTLQRDADNYRWDAEAGGGALWDVGVYPVSLFQYLMKDTPIHGVASMQYQDGVDHSSSVMLEYRDGCTAQFYVSFRSSFSTDTVIHGSVGQLYITHPFTNADACVAYIKNGNGIEYLDVPRQYLYSGEIEAMHDCLLNGNEPAISMDFSRKVIETIIMLKGLKA